MPAKLSRHSYGKSDVRVTKVIRNGDVHDLLEFSVDITLDGDFARSYTHGDNTNIIATDSMKNTVYVIAKENEFNSPESFAILLADHFKKTYPQVLAATVSVRQTNWARINVDAKPHDHAFVCGGPDLRTAMVSTTGEKTLITGGISELLVLKTTRSAFKGFVDDRYRTLKDADDRIFATKISAYWSYSKPMADYVAPSEKIRRVMLETFATHMSHAVQETMYEMGQAALGVVPEITRIVINLPNKHRIPVNLQPFDLTNKNEVFVWTDEPFGSIRATVERE